MFRAAFGLSLLLILSSPFSQAGTWTSGGGGTGFACFTNESSAARVRADAGALSDPQVQSEISSVFMTDLWENRENTYSQPEPGETTSGYLTRVLEIRLSQTAPNFYRVLNGALKRVSISTSLSPRALSSSRDTGPITQWPTDNKVGPRLSGEQRPISPKCVLVQVALRMKSRSSLAVRVNQILFNHLGDGSERSRILNEAALKLHEAIYLLGSELGQRTSVQTRRLTAVLLSNDKFESFDQLDRQVRRKTPLQTNTRGLGMDAELNQDGFGEAALNPRSRTSRLGAAMRSWEASRTRLNADLATDAASKGGSHRGEIFIRFYKARSPAESFIEVANVALGRQMISDLAQVIDVSAPGHDAAVQTTCGVARTAVLSSSAESGPVETEKLLAVTAMFRRAQAFCARGLK